VAPESSLADLLHHPVRWRVVQALIGRSLTTGELAELVPDTPPTTLYRHVGVLVKAGVLVVTDERRVRGAVERTYTLNTAAADSENDFDRYLARDEVDPLRDGVGMRQAALWLSDDELAQVQARMLAVLEPFLSHEPATGRTRRILSTILVPDS
jgi:DNA-binding transcriptional ArsR family regulator